MGATLKQLATVGKVGYWYDFRKNSMQDLSGNGNHLSATAPVNFVNSKYGRGLSLTGGGYLSVADHASQRPSNGYILAFGYFGTHKAGRFVEKRGASNTNYIFYIYDTTQIGCYDGTNTPRITTTVSNNRMFGLRWINGGTPNAFKDGVNIGALNATATFTTTNTNALTIGNAYGGGSPLGADNILTGVVLLNDYTISEETIKQIYDEWMAERGALVTKQDNYEWINPLAYSDFEKDAVWTKGTGWTIANSRASSDGSQSADSDLSQAVLGIGRKYTIQYQVSGRTAGTVNVLAGTTAGTARSADGIYTEVLTCAGNTNFIVRADLDFVGSVDWVKVHDGIKLISKNSLENVPPTTANVTTGVIPFTDWNVLSGTWAVTQGTDGQHWLKNIALGTIYRQSKQAYGTWIFRLNKPATAGNGIHFMMLLAATSSTTGQYGYFLNYYHTSRAIALGESVNGSISLLMTGTTGMTTANLTYLVAVTRSQAGAFTVYIKGGTEYLVWTLMPLSSGSNPVTDTTTTTSNFMLLNGNTVENALMESVAQHEGVLTIQELEQLY